MKMTLTKEIQAGTSTQGLKMSLQEHSPKQEEEVSKTVQSWNFQQQNTADFPNLEVSNSDIPSL